MHVYPFTFSVKKLVGVINGIVHPDDRSDLNINLHHQTNLYGSKSIKKGHNKRAKIKKKTLNRKQSAELGLFTLPTKSIKYSDMLPMHDLWLGYMRQHLSLTEGMKAPEPHEPTYDAFSKQLVKSDFHGAIIRVCRSKCPGHVGTEGIVAMDTKNTFKIVSKDNRLRSKYNYILFDLYY